MEMTLGEDGERARAKRDQILAGAQCVFLREGFAAASTDMLTHEAGVSKRTLYAYYHSKEELFVDVVRRLTIENPQTRVLDFVQGLTPHTPEELRAALLVLAHKISANLMRPEELAFMRTVIADAHRFPQLTEMLRSTIFERAAVEVSLMLGRAKEHGVVTQHGDREVMTRLFMSPLPPGWLASSTGPAATTGRREA